MCQQTMHQIIKLSCVLNHRTVLMKPIQLSQQILEFFPTKLNTHCPDKLLPTTTAFMSSRGLQPFQGQTSKLHNSHPNLVLPSYPAGSKEILAEKLPSLWVLAIKRWAIQPGSGMVRHHP